jgi:hypothetical protein
MQHYKHGYFSKPSPLVRCSERCETEWKFCTQANVKISEENIKVEQQVEEKEMTHLPVARFPYLPIITTCKVL